jgi:hypothetical protein
MFLSVIASEARRSELLECHEGLQNACFALKSQLPGDQPGYFSHRKFGKLSDLDPGKTRR